MLIAIRFEKPSSVPGKTMKKMPTKIHARSRMLQRLPRAALARIEFTASVESVAAMIGIVAISTPGSSVTIPFNRPRKQQIVPPGEHAP